MRILRIGLLFLAALMVLTTTPTVSSAQVVVSVRLAPPPLPVYIQPPIPGPGYFWVPGYWAWGAFGYYWVPGTWVLPPAIGLLWTPGYWGWSNGVYLWNAGYWGPHVGYYGGINYGFGYTGLGYEGGYWDSGRFFYNREVNNIGNTNITNVYNKTVVNDINRSTVSFNGPGGVTARPTPAQIAVAQERHIAPTPLQTQHVEAAASNPALRATANQGRPPIAATARPAVLAGPGVVPARSAGVPSAAAVGAMNKTTATAPIGPRPNAAPAGIQQGHGAPPAFHAPAQAGVARPALRAPTQTGVAGPVRPASPTPYPPSRPGPPVYHAPPHQVSPAYRAPIHPVAPPHPTPPARPAPRPRCPPGERCPQ